MPFNYGIVDDTWHQQESIRLGENARRDADLADRKRRGLMPPPQGGCGYNTCCGGIWHGPSPQCDPVGYKAKIDTEKAVKAAAAAAWEVRMADLKVKFDKQREEAAIRATLTEELRAKMAREKELAQLFTSQTPELKNTSEGQMTTAQYRMKLKKDGHAPNDDQDICHIIAHNNGGADHPDNYFVAGRSINRSLGDRNDAYLADAAGLEATKKAVAISRILTGYNGPSAEELCSTGERQRKMARA